MKAVAGDSSRLAKLILAVAVILLVAGAVDVVWAQAGPFGAPRPQTAPGYSTPTVTTLRL